MEKKPTPLTEQRLTDIEGRAAHLHEYATLTDAPLQADADQLTGEDVPALLAEVRLQQQRKYLIGQLAKRDARSGEGDKALREFLNGKLQARTDGDFCPEHTAEAEG